MEKINRNLSVHFNSKLFTGIKHETILSELEKEINLEDIKSIQMTEKSCIVMLKSEQAKYKILNSEISLKNRSVNFFEIDKNVTNVTIKDAPCEVSDQFIATHMSKYGQVINGSIKRGVIKGTNIENGTRYVQILIVHQFFQLEPILGDSKSDCMQITTGRNVHTANRQTIPITDVLLNRHQ